MVVFAIDMASPSGMTADPIRAVSVAVSMVHYHSLSLDRFQPLPDPGYAITVGGLTPGLRYYVRVTAANAASRSASAWWCARTPSSPGPSPSSPCPG